MGKRTYQPCQDAGDVYCPCDLGLAGMCLACPAINGAATCETCAWSGSCVLVQAQYHGKRPANSRVELAVQRTSQRDLGAGAFVLTVEAPRYLVDSLRPPGSFVMLRPRELPPRYNVPLTVAGINDRACSLDFFVQEVGIKSHALRRNRAELTMCAPFHNGLVGLAQLRRHPGGRILVVAKGIAQGVALRLGECLPAQGYALEVALGPGELGRILGASQLRRWGSSVTEMPRTADRNRGLIGELLDRGRHAVLISAGSDKQHRSLASLARAARPPADFIFTNNAVINCAEGICGSCQDPHNGGIRACKASDWAWPNEEV